MRKKLQSLGLCLLLILCLVSAGCGDSSDESPAGGSTVSSTSNDTDSGGDSASSETESASGSRDNTPNVLVPEASGEKESSNESAVIDYSNTSEGYVMVRYSGENGKVKLQIACPDGITYTYDLNSDSYEAFPLSGGNGSYSVTVFENISDNQYATCLGETIDVSIENEFGPYLYPNKYCTFTASSKAVAKGKELAKSADSDLDVVSSVYNYVIDNIEYDYDHAENLENGYIPDPDTTLSTGKGICLDYASLMACMLRSQSIPCQLEVGYAGEAYHAWISVYIDDVGWVNGMIEFNGSEWQIMDPTFAATSGGNDEQLKKFIGDGENYTVKYIY
ncbi:MAG: transglutaminase-like domain-containing protein [Eubacterium sp.]|nr:transglutaminase-like domain-containing protein [Eubacterium sp.]